MSNLTSHTGIEGGEAGGGSVYWFHKVGSLAAIPETSHESALKKLLKLETQIHMSLSGAPVHVGPEVFV